MSRCQVHNRFRAESIKGVLALLWRLAGARHFCSCYPQRILFHSYVHFSGPRLQERITMDPSFKMRLCLGTDYPQLRLIRISIGCLSRLSSSFAMISALVDVLSFPSLYAPSIGLMSSSFAIFGCDRSAFCKPIVHKCFVSPFCCKVCEKTFGHRGLSFWKNGEWFDLPG